MRPVRPVEVANPLGDLELARPLEPPIPTVGGNPETAPLWRVNSVERHF